MSSFLNAHNWHRLSNMELEDIFAQNTNNKDTDRHKHTLQPEQHCRIIGLDHTLVQYILFGY